MSTTGDIKRRKQLANAAYSKLKYILEDMRTTIKIKIRTLDAYVGSIFLYNRIYKKIIILLKYINKMNSVMSEN